MIERDEVAPPTIMITSPDFGPVEQRESDKINALLVPEEGLDISVKIDGNGVSDSLPYFWDTTDLEKGSEHIVSVEATDARGKTCKDSIKVIIRHQEEDAENPLSNPSEAASTLHKSETSHATKITEIIVEENLPVATKIVDRGAKENVEQQASILIEMNAESVAKLLMGIYDLPEAPEIAASLLEAMSLEKSTSVIQIMIRDGKFDYINGMFSRISHEKLNDIYSNLTKEQKDELLPHLSASVKDRITLEKPMPWTLIADIILAIAVIAGILAYLRRR